MSTADPAHPPPRRDGGSEPTDETYGAEGPDSPGRWVAILGQGSPADDAVSAVIRQHGEGRDYSNLGRLINTRGSPASRRDRKVALSFDDGPVLQTHRVVETLEHYGARGTFFLVGYKMDCHEKLIRRLASGGHEIGNHSHGHFAFPARDDIAACSALIEHVTGARPRLFRPPFGAIDRPGAEAAIEDGMRVILWGVDSEDGMPPWEGISAEEITHNVLEHVSPGSVVLLHDGLPWSRAADALPALLEGLSDQGYRLVTVSELLENPAPRGRSAAHRMARRLRRRLAAKTGSRQAGSVQRSAANGSASNRAPKGGGYAEHLADLLETLAEGVEPTPEEREDGPAGRMIRGARLGLADPRTASDLLARHAAAREVNAVRVIALGFSLRRFESDEGGSAQLPARFSARLRGANDPGAEAGLVAQELARVNRPIAARLAEQAAEASGVATERRISESGLATEPGVDRASPEFLSIFGPGPEVWERLESWGRETGRGVARRRLRALLDTAGVGGLDIEPLVDRLDVDFLFRFGYALAACGEELSRADS